MSEEITSYKGFDGDMKCREFQFEIGGTYTHDGEVKACKGGFHACEHPLDVFRYYAPANSRFAKVKQSGDLSRHDGDSKVASRHITISAEIGIPVLITEAIKYVTSKCLPANAKHATWDRSASSATGYKSASSATGNNSASLATGAYSSSEIKPTDEPQHAVAIATGYSSTARAPLGSAIVCVYREDDGELLHIRASKVGENDIKPDTWYTLNDAGKFVEVPE